MIKIKILVRLLTPTCLVAIPATAQVNYAVSGGTAYVARSFNASGDIVIASTYNGYPVTRIDDYAFYVCPNLTSVEIPDSVTRIGISAFNSCSSLTSATIGNSVTNIGNDAFNNCSRLASVSIGNSVTRIGDWAFSSCTSLMSVTIPSSVTRIEYKAFSYCPRLTNFFVAAANPLYSSLDGVLFDKAQTTLIIYPASRGGSYIISDSVTNIADFALSYCSGLTNVTIPNSVKSIGKEAFSNCSGLTSVTVPNSVISAGRGAFVDCTSLTSVTIGNGLTSIADAAFSHCTSLTNASIPNTVTSVGEFAFYVCTNLTSVTIPDIVTSIGGSAFSYCTSLASVAIPNSVTNIGYAAFSHCTSLTNVSIPNAVTSIGEFAFSDCISLIDLLVDVANPVYSSVDGVLFDKAQTTLIIYPAGRGGGYVISDSVTNIGDFAFSFCSSLTNVSIPNTVTGIGEFAFYGRSSLTSLTFLGNAPFLERDVFVGVGAGAEVYYYHGTTGWGRTYGGLPTVMLGAPAPQFVLGSTGVQPGGFGFSLSGVTNQTIVVEATTNLVNWQPIWTNTLSSASANFEDPEWLNHAQRLYRARSN